MSNMILNVALFQETVLNIPFPNKPVLMTGDRKKITMVKCTEEINEFEEATTIADQADSLVDLIYFALGGLHQMGVDTERVWDAVQHANMTKKKGLTHRGVEEDAAKPNDWTPPDHSWLDKAAAE